ncbi:hypothetical protein V6N13_078881 [Hibiscus sabdariffa]|uniref:Uncharacterized protein n=1 Tax=Hibiscus sabdariffa TaxID=183260 RepID=A0ABR2RPV7_9ROSI
MSSSSDSDIIRASVEDKRLMKDDYAGSLVAGSSTESISQRQASNIAAVLPPSARSVKGDGGGIVRGIGKVVQGIGEGGSAVVPTSNAKASSFSWMAVESRCTGQHGEMSRNPSPYES